jgi:hypothetical protein
MYYRIGDRVIINGRKFGKRQEAYVGMCGTMKHMSIPNPKTMISIWGYGIELDEPDSNGNKKIMFATKNPYKEHHRLTKLDSSKLHPKFLNYKSFKFNKL